MKGKKADSVAETIVLDGGNPVQQIMIGSPRIVCTPLVDAKPAGISGPKASGPKGADNEAGRLLAVWSRIEGKRQIIEGCFDPVWEAPFRIQGEGWCSRPATCALAGDRYLVVWDELGPVGGAVRGKIIDAAARSVREPTVFTASCYSQRFLLPGCVLLAEGMLVSADGRGEVDQRHRLVCALLEKAGNRVFPLDPPAQLDHGLLSDPAGNTSVWGYLRNRLQPGVLEGRRLFWERKREHDGSTTTTPGTVPLRLAVPHYLYLKIRHNGPDLGLPSNLAAARGPWAWTTPIWWEATKR